MRLLLFLITTFAAKLCVSDLVEPVQSESNENDKERKWPTVAISVLVRNKLYSLPYFFSCLENLDYPKDRIYIGIWTDHNEDNSDVIVDYWKNLNEDKYNRIFVKFNDTGPHYPDTTSPTQWTLSRFRNVIKLRDYALSVARQNWADFHFMLDADVFLTNRYILQELVSLDLPVVAPVLKSDGAYSNFWGAMTEKKFFKQSKLFSMIQEGQIKGCYDVPLAHSAILVNMNHPKSDYFTYNDNKMENYSGPIDDIIIFALSVEAQGIKTRVCNNNHAGYIQVPLVAGDPLSKENEQLINIKMLALSKDDALPLSESMASFVTYPTPTKLGLDEIYMINLDRRYARKNYMNTCFKELGLDVKQFSAIDGLHLDKRPPPYSYKLLPGYEDPYHKRPMKEGEVGCFLSHYSIWVEVLENDYDVVMILEDDVYFRPYFRTMIKALLHDVENLQWDLLYIGRKRLEENEEPRVSTYTVSPHYSYWTIGYLLKKSGARKLIDANPLDKMIPVDEFLPIMFDKHPNETLKNMFPERNLIALSSTPLLIEPMRYVNQPGYVSDTEDSPISGQNHRKDPSAEELPNYFDIDKMPFRMNEVTGRIDL